MTESSRRSAERCPRCGAETVDPEARFCPRCGEPLASRRADQAGPRGAAALASRGADLAGALRRGMATGGWLEATESAGVAFLAVVAAGAALVGTLKLLYPRLGAGAGPLQILTMMVVAGLLCLGIPVGRGPMTSSIFPLGAFLGIAVAIAWTARQFVARGPVVGAKERAREGAKLGIPLGALCCVAALLFRFRGTTSFGADPLAAPVLGVLWGSGIGAVGGLVPDRPLQALRRVLASLGRGRPDE